MLYPFCGKYLLSFNKTVTFISPGMWKLMAWHQNSPQTNFSSEFEVKEYGRCLWMGFCELLRNSITQYTNDICNAVLTQVLPFPLAVLPSFEVSLRPQKAFFYVNDDSLSVDIEAKYSTFFLYLILWPYACFLI